MALIRPGGVRRRRPYTGGAFLLQTWKGRVYARAWPRRRGRSSIPWQAAARDRLTISQRMAKRMPEREQTPMREGLERFMAANTGVRGLSAIRLRDWITQVFFGRAWTVTTPDGTTIHSAQAYRDCSDFLDWLDPWLGSLVTRTNTEWLPTVQCQPGKVLCLLTDGTWPGACPPAQIPPPHAAMGGYLPDDTTLPSISVQQEDEFVQATSWITVTKSVAPGATATVDLGGSATILSIRADAGTMEFAFRTQEQIDAGEAWNTPRLLTPTPPQNIVLGPNAGIREVRIHNSDSAGHTALMHAGLA